MEKNYPYRAKAMKPINPMGVSCKGEYCSDKMEGTTKPMHRPGKISAGGALVDGPYGSKKPQS